MKNEKFATAAGNLTVTSPLLPDLEEFHGLLKEIWASRWVTNMGQFHRQLERALAEYLKVPYISLFTNGTLPLLTALQALRIKGEVITTPYSFVLPPMPSGGTLYAGVCGHRGRYLRHRPRQN